MKKLTNDELKVVQNEKSTQTMPIAILLDRVRSIHNVGSFFRTGDCAGVEKIFLCGYTAYPPRPEISKVALGADETVPWEYVKDSEKMVRSIKDQGYRLIAVEQTDQSKNLYENPPPQTSCLVFGNEVDGISYEILQHCESALDLPMMGTKESLNVSVCGGAVLFEVRRQFEAGLLID